MKIKFKCQCGKRIKTPASKAYSQIECPLCHNALLVPSPHSQLVMEYECSCGHVFARGPQQCPQCGAELGADQAIDIAHARTNTVLTEPGPNAAECPAGERRPAAAALASASPSPSRNALDDIAHARTNTMLTEPGPNAAECPVGERRPAAAALAPASPSPSPSVTDDIAHARTNTMLTEPGPHHQEEPVARGQSPILAASSPASASPAPASPGKAIEPLPASRLDKATAKAPTPQPPDQLTGATAPEDISWALCCYKFSKKYIGELSMSIFILAISLFYCLILYLNPDKPPKDQYKVATSPPARPSSKSKPDLSNVAALRRYLERKSALRSHNRACASPAQSASQRQAAVLPRARPQRSSHSPRPVRSPALGPPAGNQSPTDSKAPRVDHIVDMLIRQAQQHSKERSPQREVQPPRRRKQLDAVYFQQVVQPILLKSCASPACHGGKDAGAYVLRRDNQPRSLKWNLTATQRWIKFQQPQQSPWLLKTLTPREGGIEHGGGIIYHRSDYDYQCLLAFVNGTKAPPKPRQHRTVMLDYAYFTEQVQPVLEADCAFGHCHAGPQAGRYHLKAGETPAERAYNFRMSLQFVRPHAPQESPLFMKPLSHHDGGTPHQGGTRFRKGDEAATILRNFINGAKGKHQLQPPPLSPSRTSSGPQQGLSAGRSSRNSNSSSHVKPQTPSPHPRATGTVKRSQMQVPARDAHEVFFRRVLHKPLVKHCGRPNCHGGRAAGSFHLISARRTPQRSLTQIARANYLACLRLIQPGKLQRSALLQKPLSVQEGGWIHGGGDCLHTKHPYYQQLCRFIRTAPHTASQVTRPNREPTRPVNHFKFFRRKVQPLLVGCALVSCHGGYRAGKLQLERADSSTNIYKNYRRVIRFVQWRNIAHSPLILKPLKRRDGGQPHGGGALFGKHSYAYRVLSNFINENYNH